VTVVAFWACAQLEANRERLALHRLRLGGFTTYLPRLLERRLIKGRSVISKLPLFPGCAFVWIELQWHAARWCPGVLRLVLDGAQPAKVPDQVIGDLKKRERNGAIELPPPSDFQRGDQVRITRGLFAGQLALFDGMRGHERVAVRLRRNRPRIAIDAIVPSAGIAVAMNISRACQPCASSTPPRRGPAIAPTRPEPNAQPAPVERIIGG
jgi:transcription antitermination factor NusG